MTSSGIPLSLVQIWLEYLHWQGRSPHTLNAYLRAWQHLAQWYEGSYGEPCDPARLIARDIRDWKSYQQSVEKAAPSTINQRLVAASSFYKWATSQDQTPRDPTRDIPTMRLPRRQPQSLSSKQLRQLLRAVHNGGSRRAVAMIELLAGTGIRVGELLQLQVGDLVLRERSGWITAEGKHSGYRQIPLTKEVRQALAAYLEVHPYNKEEHDRYQDDWAPLWWASRALTIAVRSCVSYAKLRFVPH